MHFFYVLAYYLFNFSSFLIIGSYITEFKPRRKWACLSVILLILMLPEIILDFSGYFATGYEGLPLYAFLAYPACIIPVIWGTSPKSASGTDDNITKKGFKSFIMSLWGYLFNWFSIFIISYIWYFGLAVGASSYVTLFVPTIIPVRALFSLSQIYELICFIILNIISVVLSCFILKKIKQVIKNRLVFLFVNFLYLIPTFAFAIRNLAIDNFPRGDYVTLLSLVFSLPIILIMASVTIKIGEIIQIRKNYRLIENEYKVKFEAYSEYRDFIEESKKFRHDLVNHLSVLSSSLYESENSTELVKLKQNTEELISETKKLKINEYRSVPSILNALFAIKEHSAEEKNIDLKYQIALSDKLFISDYDLVGILSNLLDNALEACDKISDKEKDIVLKMFNRNGYLCIDITNTFNPENDPIKNNFRTTKDNNLEHGFGSHIIASIVKKYNGYINISNTDEKITIYIALNNS